MSWLSDLLHRLFPRRPPVPPPPSPTGDARADLFAAINAQRAAQGRPALRRDGRLDSAAQEWAETMARTGVLDHGNSSRIYAAGYRARDLDENIAEGYTTAAACVAGWMASKDGHREAVLGDFRDVGLGAAVDTRGRVWWCMDVATEAT